MKTKLWPLMLLALGGLLPSGICPAASISEDGTDQPDVQQLIKQLGHDDYLLRQQAEAELLQLGAAAFAQLQTAERHADLEVATRARYILNQISIEWVRSTDPPVVQSMMSRYGELSMQLKLAKIRELAKLPDEQGFAALSRIARYDTSSGIVARYAALETIEKGLLPIARAPKAAAMLRGELGESNEAPSTWIEMYADQIESPERVHPRWLELIDEEIELLSEAPSETDDALTLGLIRAHLDLSDQLDDDQAILAGWERRFVLAGDSEEDFLEGLERAIAWLTEREQWSALSLLEDRYVGEIKASRTLLYRLALAREKQGRTDEAQLVAEQALAVPSDDFAERNECADLIAARGHHDWAEREWYAIVDAAEATDFQSLLARNSLGLYCLNDRLEHKAAADLLTESIDAVDQNPDAAQAFAELNQLRFLKMVKSNRDFFLANHFANGGDFEKERKYLDQAYQLEPENADILIAMFHSQHADEAYRKKSQTRLAAAKKKLEVQISQFKQVKRRTSKLNRELAQRYNHWAWLVSNTEGDYDKAVAYSKRSLDLQPGSPSYLDTLGRCYYAAGDVENALKVQREAVAKQPYLMVMQRQLQLFENEVAKRELESE
ncbi:MAG: hypothetical protein AAGD11_13955 [Planctomycetota bacterium]